MQVQRQRQRDREAERERENSDNIVQTLVSPAPAGGNTNWFDPFFEVKQRILLTSSSLGYRLARLLAVGLTTSRHTIMTGTLTM